MNSTPIHIRSATVSEHAEIAVLLGQLGYDSSATDVLSRLNAIQESSTDLVLVASGADTILGLISLHILPLFHVNGFLGRITSLVVGEASRGQGVGSALMKAAEEWFLANHCIKIEVTSGDHRTDARRFYESHGLLRDGERLSKTFVH